MDNSLNLNIFNLHIPGIASGSAFTMGLFPVFIILKWITVLGLGMYSIFALVIIKQVSIMTETFEGTANPIVKLFSWIHFLASLLLTLAVILLV